RVVWRNRCKPVPAKRRRYPGPAPAGGGCGRSTAIVSGPRLDPDPRSFPNRLLVRTGECSSTAPRRGSRVLPETDLDCPEGLCQRPEKGCGAILAAHAFVSA